LNNNNFHNSIYSKISSIIHILKGSKILPHVNPHNHKDLEKQEERELYNSIVTPWDVVMKILKP
jgi:hypothetical protein